ncbi:hypothetical protein [Streptomyces sp.]|uniref:hypothetical protein n=1 Tax=Streptomyces sp. TaxID=1931 RepID=UPI002F42551B
MRFRHTVAAVACALAAAFSFPGAAQAAEGEFSYTYVDDNGTEQTAVLTDPADQQCITLPEADDAENTYPAHSPSNDTDAAATVFTGPGCTGDYFTLRPAGGHASARLKLRSVVFF